MSQADWQKAESDQNAKCQFDLIHTHPTNREKTHNQFEFLKGVTFQKSDRWLIDAWEAHQGCDLNFNMECAQLFEIPAPPPV